jgi:hypothetical protein
MTAASERVIHALEHIVKAVPVGTNLALLHLLWAMLSGAFLQSRGAVFSALQLAGFTVAQILSFWQALRCGAWRIADLVRSWRSYVLSQGQWQPNCYEGYSPVAVDLTAFWRPRLKGPTGKFFQRLANRALKGVGLGLIVQVGRVGDRRIPLFRHILRPQKADMNESQLKRQVLEVAARDLGEHEVLVHDAGASIADMQAAGVPRYVVRMALSLLPGAIGCRLARKKGARRSMGSLSVRYPEPTKAVPYRLAHRMWRRRSRSRGVPFKSRDGGTWCVPIRK